MKYEGHLQTSMEVWVYNSNKDLMVDGETYECVKSFCYLGDTLDGDGGADLAATARIRNEWMKFRELLPFLHPELPRWR